MNASNVDFARRNWEENSGIWEHVTEEVPWISYRGHTANGLVRTTVIRQGHKKPFISAIKKWKLLLLGQVAQRATLSKTVLQSILSTLQVDASMTKY